MATKSTATAPIPPALDIFEVATAFKCSHMTVRRMIAEGRLPAVKIGRQWRIRREVVLAYLSGKSA
ncbi:helix-turn-helix domain-containing protein [Mycobacterium colombiense]|uniref:helix-turn-helix domain-containing protein n=1 Tax=Mycobacterium colombiense TaxID=339268 RepID=UPI00200B1021|nr:helix-turn-helix domain-containing protein [Mycobacterium colombiense]MCK8645635.1 helix-turn-helix domain-containing protein [Mycobacterium colombiense]